MDSLQAETHLASPFPVRVFTLPNYFSPSNDQTADTTRTNG